MAIPTRHAGAPHLGGENLRYSDIEHDVSALYGEFNGNLDNANFSPAAGIAGSKLLDASVAGAKLTDASVLNDKVQDAAVTNAKLTGTFGVDKVLSGALINAAMGQVDSEVEVPNGVWTELGSVTLTTSPAASFVLIWAYFRLRQMHVAGTIHPFQFRVKRDSTVLYTTGSLRYWLGNVGVPYVTVPVCPFWTETGHSVSTAHSWKVDGFSLAGSNYCTQRRVVAAEGRR